MFCYMGDTITEMVRSSLILNDSLTYLLSYLSNLLKISNLNMEMWMSNWYEVQNIKIRKEFSIVLLFTRKDVKIMAAKIIILSLETFIDLLRFACTLLAFLKTVV